MSTNTVNLIQKIQQLKVTSIIQPLPEKEAEDVLLSRECHVDHEGFDLNEIEQAYYRNAGLVLTKDPTWYKDGLGETGAVGIIYPWDVHPVLPEFNLISSSKSVIVDHAQLVFRYPLAGEAYDQVLRFAQKRPELLRLLSVSFKCGLDLCLDYIDVANNAVSPVFHLEWDFDDKEELIQGVQDVEQAIQKLTVEKEWDMYLQVVERFNIMCKQARIDAFEQADFRAMLFFSKRAYKLIPTL